MSCLYEDAAKGQKKNRTSEQQKVISYFSPASGCIGALKNLGNLKDEQYEEMVANRVKQYNSMEKALQKLGIDIDMVKEVKPIYFEGYYFDDSKTMARLNKQNEWISSSYECTWIFCGSEQIYVYSYRFSMIEDGKKETAEEYFYKDITNISHSSETIEKDVYDSSCISSKVGHKNVNYNTFMLSAMGDKLYCSMHASDDNEKAIQGLKNKLREKKNANR